MDEIKNDIRNIISKLKNLIRQKDDKIIKLTRENVILRITILKLMEDKIKNS